MFGSFPVTKIINKLLKIFKEVLHCQREQTEQNRKQHTQKYKTISSGKVGHVLD